LKRSSDGWDFGDGFRLVQRRQSLALRLAAERWFLAGRENRRAEHQGRNQNPHRLHDIPSGGYESLAEQRPGLLA